jgi:hypothetical protein
MVWTDAVQGAARSSGRSLGKRCNVAMRRPDHLPGGFAPESTLDSVAPLQGAYQLASWYRSAGGRHVGRNPCYTLANMHSYSTRRAPCQPRFWCERVPSY